MYLRLMALLAGVPLYISYASNTCCSLTYARHRMQVKRAAVGEKHAEYVQSLVVLAELKKQQGNSPDALLLFCEAAEVLQHQDPTFSASESCSLFNVITVLTGSVGYTMLPY